MEDEEFDAEQEFRDVVAMDQQNIHNAMDRLIDSVSNFKANPVDEIDVADFAQMLADLDFAKFIVSGVMYHHGLPYCGHEHEEEE